MIRKELNSGFQIRIAGKPEWYSMSVPGSAMDTFCREGVLPDPYYGTNEYEVREFFRNDFEIRGSFRVSREEYEKEQILMIFHGVDTVADIFLNGKKLGHVENMHRVYPFSVKDWVKEGENVLELHVKSPIAFMEGYQPAKGREIHMVNTGTMPGSQYIRKSHSMFGWDWGPQLPDAGIFRKIELVSFCESRLLDTFIRQRHEEGKVTLVLETALEGSGEVSYQVVDPQGQIIYEGEEKEIVIKKPDLWWPYGMGEQSLYTVKVRLVSEKDGVEEKSYRIGLRTLTVSREEDQWGEEFAFMVNEVKIFAKGANYIPDDCFYSHITREVLERDVKAAVFANFNCLRVWGGGYYPSDEFYDLCDEYGILVWQDLMFACNVYDLTEEFAENICEEAKDNLIRFRNHASLALVSGNNEMEIAWLEWKDVVGHAPSLKKDYLLQFEYLLANVVREYAPDTFYWPSSPSSGGSFDDPGDENRGDSHYWDVWHGQLPFSEYLNHYFRFCSEFGFQSLPSVKTIRTFSEEKDRNLFSRVMESHQKNPAANGKILYYLSETFRYPNGLENLSFLSQILQGYAMKTATDHWRRNRGRCMGSIYWQFNDNWPVASWSSMDYYGRYKALHYMARRFFAPVAGSIEKKGSHMGFWISNETLKPVTVEARVSLKTLDFEILDEETVTMTVEAMSAGCLKEKDYAELIRGRDESVFLSVEYVYDRDGQEIRGTEFETFVPIKHVELQDPGFEIRENEDGSLTVSAKSFVPYFMLEGTEGDPILEDNVIAFTDDKPVTFRIWKDSPDKKEHAWTIYDVYHTYEEQEE